MNEAVRKRVVYSVLVAAILFGLYNFTIGKKVASLPTDPGHAPSVAVVDTLGSSRPKIDLEESAAKPWGRDPFVRTGTVSPRNAVPSSPTAYQSPTRSAIWILTGIVYSSTSPLAYINQKAVRVGDIVDQARVVKIDKNKVVLEHNGDRFDIYVTKG